MLVDWFKRLDLALYQSQHWWQLSPFHEVAIPWDDPISAWLNDLQDSELDDYATQPTELINMLAEQIPQAKILATLAECPVLPSLPVATDRWFMQGIPGRKWSQIRNFAGALPPLTGPVLEWCAGKGHLGRLLAKTHGIAINSIEWQQGLCAEGSALAQKQSVEQHFTCADAFSPAAAQVASETQTCIALHACGDLHTHLMQHWQAKPGNLLAVAPCCYHLTANTIYRPLSQTAQSGQLKLQRSDLHLPVQHALGSSPTELARRNREVHWRLAFDEWQRNELGSDQYLPLPNIQKSLLTKPFIDFMRWACDQKDLILPAQFEPHDCLKRGAARLAKVRRMELITHLFRRPLELWLILDRALYLQEKGADVSVGLFCDYQLTPRNFLILAQA